jgi:hypothetical protein
MKVRVRTTTAATVRLSGIQKTAVTVGIQGPAGVSGGILVSDLTDVDLTGITDGAVLVFSTQTGKWVAQTLLDKQQVDLGDESF